MAEVNVKARMLFNGAPTDVGLQGLLAGFVPAVPIVINGVPATISDAISRATSGAYKAVSDSDYQCLASDLQVGMVSLTGPRTVFLPDVDTFPYQDLVIADESGACSDTLTITIQPGPNTEDTIAGYSSIIISNPYQALRFRRGAANLWIRL